MIDLTCAASSEPAMSTKQLSSTQRETVFGHLHPAGRYINLCLSALRSNKPCLIPYDYRMHFVALASSHLPNQHMLTDQLVSDLAPRDASNSWSLQGQRRAEVYPIDWHTCRCREIHCSKSGRQKSVREEGQRKPSCLVPLLHASAAITGPLFEL